MKSSHVRPESVTCEANLKGYFGPIKDEVTFGHFLKTFGYLQINAKHRKRKIKTMRRDHISKQFVMKDHISQICNFNK